MGCGYESEDGMNWYGCMGISDVPLILIVRMYIVTDAGTSTGIMV